MSIIRTDGDGFRTPSRHLAAPRGDGTGLSPSVPRDEITIGSIFASLRRHVVLIVAATAVTSAVAANSVRREVPVYRATAVVRLTDAREAITRGVDDDSRPRPYVASSMQSRVQVLKSRALAGAVVDSLGLRLRPVTPAFRAALLEQVRIDPAVARDSFILRFSKEEVIVRNGGQEKRVPYKTPYRTAGVTFAVRSHPGIEQATLMLVSRDGLIERIAGGVAASPRNETNVVDVSFTDVDPALAQRVVNQVVLAFQDVDVRQAQGQSRRRRLFLEEQLREVNEQLARSESALSSFREREQVFSSREKFQAQQAALLALDMRRGELDADRRVYESLLARIHDKRSEQRDDELRALIAAPDVSANAVVTQLYQQLARYQGARDSLTTGEWRSTLNNPDVARLDQLIAATEQRLVSAVRGHMATVDARQEALGALRERTASAIAALPRTESAEGRLTRQVESNRALADRLREEFQKARIAEAVEAGHVEIVDLATLPYSPVGRMRSLRLMLGVLIGLAIGGVAALVIDGTNARVKGRPDLEGDMRLAVLSVIPPITPDVERSFSLSRLATFLPNVGRGDDHRLRIAREGVGVSGHRDMSPAGAEAFRLLRSSLKWSQRDAGGKTLLISSALSNEGKTTTTVNLAAVCALEGKRVLVIDCDLRRSRLHRVFRVPRQPGLAQVLSGALSPAATVRDTFVDGLSLMPAGARADRFADLLGSNRMRALLQELSAYFDMIILDTPPVLAVADAAALAPLVDGVLLVVGAGATQRYAVEEALQRLESVGASVVGAVLNDSRGEVPRYGGRYSYYYPYETDYAESTGAV